MTQLIRRFCITALVVLSLATVMPNIANAQDDFVNFCQNGGKLLLSQLPAENPCPVTGTFKTVQLWSDSARGEDYVTQSFTDFSALKTEAAKFKDGSVYFEADGGGYPAPTGEFVLVPFDAQVRVTAQCLNQRSGPGTNYAQVGKCLSKGTTLQVVGRNGEWYFVPETAVYVYGGLTSVVNTSAVGADVEADMNLDTEAENTAPRAYTNLYCKGQRAVVFQKQDESGDGVTVSVYDRNPCDGPHLAVELWGNGAEFPEGACFADRQNGKGNTIEAIAERTGWFNGSGWKVDASLINHPLVVPCSEVTDKSTWGLNPQEDQVRVSELDWVYSRANDLLSENGMTLAEYCADYSADKISKILCHDIEK